MSRIKKAFEKKAFIAFAVAGDPDVKTSEEIILEIIRAGADLIEIGIPFSDPIAEGPVIQEASARALASDATLENIFNMVKDLRSKTEAALVFLTYLNPVYKYGADNFFKKCQEIGIDGVIIPDLPYEELGEINKEAQKYSIDIVPFVAPTSKERIMMTTKDSSGFIYVVSSMGTTGVREKITTNLDEIVGHIREVSNTPCAIGFGISTPEQAKKFANIADGVIVGSAIVRLIGQYGKDCLKPVYDYVKSMKDAIS